MTWLCIFEGFQFKSVITALLAIALDCASKAKSLKTKLDIASGVSVNERGTLRIRLGISGGGDGGRARGGKTIVRS